MPTSVRLNPSQYEELKQMCEAKNISIAKILKTLTVLFLHDDVLRERVFAEAKTK